METINYTPTYMKSLINWILWRKEDVNGRLTKVPYSARYNGKASSTNAHTWTDYENATVKLNADPDHFDGLGFVLNEPTRLVFIDIDHCIRDDGSLSSEALDILETFGNNTFCEVSQSGSGLHIFAKGTIPRSFKNTKLGIEMYSTARFCAMTFNALIPVEPAENQEAIDIVFNKYKLPEKEKKQPVPDYDIPLVTIKDMREIIEMASNCPSGATFRDLFKGIYPEGEHSEADIRLCKILAFWTDRNTALMDSIFRVSGLYREKWERESYRIPTLERACNDCDESFSDWALRKRKEEIRAYADKLFNR